MLSLTDGFSIDGVDFYRDDERKEIFYYLPSKVQVARNADGTPQFQFVLYQTGLPIEGKQNGGGYLLFTTILTEDKALIDTRAKDKAQEILRSEAGTGAVDVPVAQIRAANFIGGSARLLMAKADGTLIRSVELGKPSLFGQNTVSVLADMPFDGAQVFADVLRQGGNIATIEYNLEFEVRLPAVVISAHIETSRVREAVAEFDTQSVTTGDIWGSETTEVRKRTGFSEFLEEKSLVQLDIKAGTSEVELDDEVIGELRDFALGAMDKFINEQWMGVGGILTEEQLQSEWLEFIDEDFSKNFDMNLTQSDVVVRPFNPSSMVDPTFIGGDINDYLIIVDTIAHPFFRRLEVNVSTSFDFEKYKDFVHSVVVDMHYESRDEDGRMVEKSESFIFTEADHTPKTFVTAKGKTGDNEYEITAEVHYRNGPVQKRRLFSTRSVAPAQVVDIGNPGEIDVTFSVPAAGFAEGLMAIEVELSYQDRRNDVMPFTEMVLLDKDNLTKQIRRPIYVTEMQPFAYRYVHVFPTQRIESPWFEAAAGTRNLRIPTPFDDRLQVDLIPSADWSEVSSLVVNLSYEDEENDVRAQQTFNITVDDVGKAKAWSVNLVDPEKRSVKVAETQVMKNGAARTLPVRTITADGTALVVGNAPGGVMKLTITPEDLAMGTDIKRVAVELTYADPASGILDQHRALLRDVTETSVWTVALANPTRTDFTYSAEYTLVSGERVMGPQRTGKFLRPDDWLFIEAPGV